MLVPYSHPGLDMNAALVSVINQVPDWLTLLDNLNNQIALRQYELQQLGGDRPPTRSLRPKGSTESLLRPKEFDEDENTVAALQDPAQPLALRDTILLTPSTPQHTLHTNPNDSSPRPGPAPSRGRTSQRQSVASCKLHAPKSQSMVVVYYDSAVQHAFEELGRLIGASGDAMMKYKKAARMTARMADMKKMVEMEAVFDVEELASKETPNAINGLEADIDDSELPKLQFVSTRRMGPSRDSPAAALLRNKASNGHLSSPGRRMMLPGYQGSSNGREPGSFFTISDELGTGLKWCQSMCEHAAHQFLRGGTCETEIREIKKRLSEVKEIAEREKVKVLEERKEKEKKDKMDGEGGRGEEQAQEETQKESRDPFVRCT